MPLLFSSIHSTDVSLEKTAIGEINVSVMCTIVTVHAVSTIHVLCVCVCVCVCVCLCVCVCAHALLMLPHSLILYKP